jgi:adenosylcobinamide kinase / adenosylcobinamide-phosphate guanylyltransferase
VLILGGARSGKSALAEELAAAVGGDSVLYVATALANRDPELEERVRRHRERRPAGWGTLELGGGALGAVLEAAKGREAVLLDSLTMWVSARMLGGEDKEATLRELDRFLEGATALATPLILVSDEVGLGVVPESDAGRAFRDLLGLANQRAAAAAAEVRLCVAGIGMRVK